MAPPKFAPLDDLEDDSEDDIEGLMGESDAEDEQVEMTNVNNAAGKRGAGGGQRDRFGSIDAELEPPLSTAVSQGGGTRCLAILLMVLLFASFIFFLTGGRESSGTEAPSGTGEDAYGYVPSASEILVYSPTTVPAEDTFIHSPSTVPSPDGTYSPTTVPSPDKTTVPSPDQTTVPSPDKTTVPSPDKTTVPSPDKTTVPSPDVTTTGSPTNTITVSPTVATAHPVTSLAPTPPPVVIDDSPVVSIADPRYGVDPVYSPGRLQYQQTLLTERHKWMTVDLKAPSNLSLNQRYDAFCQDQNAQKEKMYPFKYRFPAFPLSPTGAKSKKLEFDPKVMKRHFVQYRNALYEYREFLTQPPTSQTGPFYSGNRTAMDNRLGLKFARLIAARKSSLIIGFQGSSVMAGQDNCHGLILSETVRRYMDRLLGSFGITTDIRNMGQNGDGPDMPSQMLCSYDTMGYVDLLVGWYWMIPDPGVPDILYSSRRILDNTHIWDVGGMAGNTRAWVDDGYTATYTDVVHNVEFWAFGGGHWGRHGDGHCHYKTREGWPGIFMQNWHFGPLGFETLTDQITMAYVNGLIRAMEILDDWNGQGEPSLPANLLGASTTPHAQDEAKFNSDPKCTTKDAISPFISMDCYSMDIIKRRGRVACFTGYGPQWSDTTDIFKDWYQPAVHDGTFPFDKTGVQWNYNKIKGPSRGNGYESEAYLPHPELNCSAFPDIGYGFQTSGKGPTQWLAFKMRAEAAAKLVGATSMSVLACTGCRCGPWGHPTFTIQYGHNGKPVGPAVDLSWANTTYIYYTCLEIARQVPVPKVGDIFGFRFDLGASGGSALVQTVALVGEF